MQRGEGRERNHRAGFVANVNFLDVVRQHAIRRVEHDDDLLDAIAVHEIIHVRRIRSTL